MTSNNGERPRRFYMESADLSSNPSDFAFVNKNEALIEGRTAGTHKFPMKGWPAPFSVGIPPLRKPPALVVGVDEDQLLDIYGLGKRYVSPRAKALLSSIDPDAFEFAECMTVDGVGKSIESYWMMDVIRVVEDFDKDKSSVIRYNERFPDARDASTNNSIIMLNEMYFPDLPGDAHAFYVLGYWNSIIFDDVLLAAWRDAGLTGLEFTPLQPPTEEEFAQRARFQNDPYWSESQR